MSKREEFRFTSGDKSTMIYGVRWLPEKQEPVAVLQIIHGMAEHIGRYREFADYLTGKGILVTGHDHLGHGRSITGEEKLGYFCRQDGNQVLLGDINQVCTLTKKQYPGLPFFMLGHSMGSFLLRQFLTGTGAKPDGALIMGTGHQPALVLKAASALVRLLARLQGWEHRSALVDKLAFGSYNNKLKPVRTSKDWLSRDIREVDQYIRDKRCGFVFTLNGFDTMFQGMYILTDKKRLKNIPPDLPVFFLSGAADPVGGYGQGARRVCESFEAAGLEDVTWKLYENDRHELLNELDKDTVYSDIYAWLNVQLCMMGIGGFKHE